MLTTSRYLGAPRRLRAFVRAHATSLVVLAALVGTIGGWVVLAMSVRLQGCMRSCSTSIRDRLSSQLGIDPLRAAHPVGMARSRPCPPNEIRRSVTAT